MRKDDNLETVLHLIHTEEKVMVRISLVVPILNEESYIESFLDSILKQDYDRELFELLLVDGESSDSTVELINKKLENIDIDFKIIKNEKRITPVAVNLGIKHSKYEVIMRLDAHSIYPMNYLSKSIQYLTATKADNVGCLIKPVFTNEKEEMISKMLSSKFGVGNSEFRLDSESGYVDTVPFGTFHKKLFSQIGLYDERLERGEDNEFNTRILKNGGKIYLFNDISINYQPRNTVKKLLKMAFSNGLWNVVTMVLHPGSMRLRHFIPFLFVLSILFGLGSVLLNVMILKFVFLFELLLYFSLDGVFSVKNSKNIRGILFLFILYPSFHIAYGLGSFKGILKCLSIDKNYMKEYL